MEYIVLDLEWNQCPKGKEFGEKQLPFEIIEIGAVKLNEKLNIVSSFNRYIKPQVYTELHSIVKDIIKVDVKKIENGESFVSVIRKFLEWCGKDYIFCTWGQTDLYELQRNMKYFGVEIPFETPLIYYDIQKFYSILKEDGKKRSTLESVVEELNIPKKSDFHNALSDAHYTALVCKSIDFYSVKNRFSIDYYHVPGARSEEIYARYDTYEKYISRGYDTRECLTKDRVIFTGKCYICGRTMKKKTGWFLNGNHGYYYLGCCEEHGYIKGRMRIKQSDDGRYFAVRILKATDEAGAQKMLIRQADIIRKRREKRKED